MMENRFEGFRQTESGVDYETNPQENPLNKERAEAILKDLEEKLHDGMPKVVEKDAGMYEEIDVESLENAIPEELSRNGIELEEGSDSSLAEEEPTHETIDFATEELERSLRSEIEIKNNEPRE